MPAAGFSACVATLRMLRLDCLDGITEGRAGLTVAMRIVARLPTDARRLCWLWDNNEGESDTSFCFRIVQGRANSASEPSEYFRCCPSVPGMSRDSTRGCHPSALWCTPSLPPSAPSEHCLELSSRTRTRTSKVSQEMVMLWLET
jgi:hypothetical protein